MPPDVRAWDHPPDPADLVPRERDPRTGRPVRFDHDDKQRRDRRPDRGRRPSDPSALRTTRLPRARPRWLLPVGAAGATVAVVVGVVLATSGTPAPVLDADPVAASAAAVATVSTPGPASATTPSTGSAPASAVPAPTSTAAAAPALTVSSAPAPTTAPTSTAPAGTAPSSSALVTRSAPSTRTSVAGPPAALTAARIWGYRISSTTVRVVNPDLTPGVTAGDRYEGVVRCPGGRCPAVAGIVGAFTAATPQVLTRSSRGSTAQSRCEPTVFTNRLVRAGDGSYRGVWSILPRATEASWNDGVQRSCRTFAIERVVTMTPLVLPAAVPAGISAALDPSRITGYRYPGAATVGAEYLPRCAAGWCTLRCPIDGCAAEIAFPAAPSRFVVPAVPLATADCGSGVVRFVAERDAAGGLQLTIVRVTSSATPACRETRYLQAVPVTR